MDETSETQTDLKVKQLLVAELRGLILGARERVARTVNKELVMLYWSVGRRIREDVLGAERAKYGEEIVSTLSLSLIHILRAHETPEHLVCRLLLEKNNSRGKT